MSGYNPENPPPCANCRCEGMSHPASAPGGLPAGVEPCSNCDACHGYVPDLGSNEPIVGNDPSDEREPQAPAVEAAKPRFEEWHVTVDDTNAIDWFVFCVDKGIKPLFVELSTGELQLMCAASFDPTPLIEERGRFKIIRIKHEVSELREGEVALYYEAHLKFDGLYRADLATASRDLYRLGRRWYLTKRHPKKPIDLVDFGERGRIVAKGKENTLVGGEAEIVVLDTNPGLDTNWMK